MTHSAFPLPPSPTPSPCQAHILAAITGIGLKSLVECVRLVALGRAGLQQLQLDCHYLRPPLRRLTGGTGNTAQVERGDKWEGSYGGKCHGRIFSHSALHLPSPMPHQAKTNLVGKRPAVTPPAPLSPPLQVIDSLLDEVVSAGVERCLEPALLENNVLDRILSASSADGQA